MSNVNYNLANYYNILKTKGLLYKNQFLVQFMGTPISELNGVQYMVQAAKIPGSQLANGTVKFYGNDFQVPGVKQYQHSWTCTFIIDENFKQYEYIQRWFYTMSHLKLNGGGQKKIGNAKAKVIALNTDYTQAQNTFYLQGIWINKIPSINLQYQEGGGDLVKPVVQFKYQYVWSANGDDNVDPLAAGNSSAE